MIKILLNLKFMIFLAEVTTVETTLAITTTPEATTTEGLTTTEGVTTTAEVTTTEAGTTTGKLLKFSYLKIRDQMGVANFYLSNQIFALNKDPTFLRINEFLKKIRCSRILNQKFGQF